MGRHIVIHNHLPPPKRKTKDAKPAFEEWMKQVDNAVSLRSGMSVHDLPDCPFRDWYNAGNSAGAAAQRCIKNAGQGDRAKDSIKITPIGSKYWAGERFRLEVDGKLIGSDYPSREKAQSEGEYYANRQKSNLHPSGEGHVDDDIKGRMTTVGGKLIEQEANRQEAERINGGGGTGTSS